MVKIYIEPDETLIYFGMCRASQFNGSQIVVGWSVNNATSGRWLKYGIYNISNSTFMGPYNLTTPTNNSGNGDWFVHNGTLYAIYNEGDSALALKYVHLMSSTDGYNWNHVYNYSAVNYIYAPRAESFNGYIYFAGQRNVGPTTVSLYRYDVDNKMVTFISDMDVSGMCRYPTPVVYRNQMWWCWKTINRTGSTQIEELGLRIMSIDETLSDMYIVVSNQQKNSVPSMIEISSSILLCWDLETTGNSTYNRGMGNGMLIITELEEPTTPEDTPADQISALMPLMMAVAGIVVVLGAVSVVVKPFKNIVRRI